MGIKNRTFCFLLFSLSSYSMASHITVGDVPSDYEQVMQKMYARNVRNIPMHGMQADKPIVIRNAVIIGEKKVCIGKLVMSYTIRLSDNPSLDLCGSESDSRNFLVGVCPWTVTEEESEADNITAYERFGINSYNPLFGNGHGLEGDTLELRGLDDKRNTSLFLRTRPKRTIWNTGGPEWVDFSGDHYLYGTFKHLRWCN